MKRKTTIKEILEGKIPNKILNNLNRSFEIVGDIAITELTDEQTKYEKEIGNAIMQVNKSIKTVLKKSGIHKGEFRTQDLIYIAGKNKKETIYQENGIKLYINPETVYFSARLSVERQKLMERLEPNKRVLVMFSGIGPYSFVALKKQPNLQRITSIELNPEGHKFALRNLDLNKNVLKKSTIFQNTLKYFKENKIRINEKELIKNLNSLKINFINGDVKKEIVKLIKEPIKKIDKNTINKKEIIEIKTEKELFQTLKNYQEEKKEKIILDLDNISQKTKEILSYFLIQFIDIPKFICKINNNFYEFKTKLEKTYLFNYLENPNQNIETIHRYDEIYMPLPKSAELFLEDSFKIAGKNSTIHMYDFILEKDFPKKTENAILEKAKEKNKNIKIIETRKVGQYAPGKFRVCCDFKILN